MFSYTNNENINSYLFNQYDENISISDPIPRYNENIVDDYQMVLNSDIGKSLNMNSEKFIIEKIPFGQTIRGKIKVDGSFFTKFTYIHKDNSTPIYAVRSLTGFNIYSNIENNKLITCFNGNVFGTKYYLGDFLKVNYETKFLQNGKPRSFNVLLGELTLRNKKPYYNSSNHSYSLDFNGQRTQPSAKNFQIIHPLDQTYITLTLGKQEENLYILDYTYPWSALNAFCVGLTALDHKFGND